VRSVLSRILEREGYAVVCAEDGAQGIEEYSKRPRGVNLVILDMAMPRMNGSDAYKALKLMNPEVKVIVSSGYSEEGRAAELMADGAKGFLRKPYASDAVLSMVRGVLDG
jgi:two-component system cell cycle sensor histidine kinase/response regulator CckA